MNKKEAIRAMLDGERVGHGLFIDMKFVSYHTYAFRRDDCAEYRVNLLPPTGFYIYEEPKDKKIEKIIVNNISSAMDNRNKINELIDAVNLLNKGRE